MNTGFNNKKPCGLWHMWQNMFLHICYCMMTRFYIFGKCLLGWCSFQCYCCFTMSECHVPTTNSMPYYTMSVWHGQIADVSRSDVHPQLIELSATEFYYTMSVWDVEECSCTQVKCTSPCKLNPVLQSCTTSYQFEMWKYAGIPRSHVHTSITNHSATEPYYTMSVWHVEKCRHTQVRCTPTP